MGNKAEVADYVATLTAELVPLCREVRLSELAFLLAMASSEAKQRAAEPRLVKRRPSTH
jgi:hypothetical protein